MNALLKEIDQKKQTLDRARPLPKVITDKLAEYLNVEWTYTSNAIEGNTLSRQETMLILKEGITVEGKSLREHLEATNHQNAIDFLEELLTKVEPIQQTDVKAIHNLVLKGIDNRYAGHYRDVAVYIAGSTYVPPKPEQVSALMEQFSMWLVDRQEQQDLHPIRFAAGAHFKLVDIHPFIDGNGRTARLLMNLILMKYGYPIAIIDCELTKRTAYYQALSQGHTGDLLPFERMIAEYVDTTLDKYLAAIPQETP